MMLIGRPKVDDRTRLETMIRDTGREILDRTEQKDVWTVFIRQGTYLLFIMHRKDEKFMSVVFPLRFTDETLIGKIDTALKDPIDLAKFQYKLKKAISTPYSSFLIHTQDNFFTGFDTIAKIYVFEPEFCLHELETAIASAVNSGIVGLALIATILGETGLEQQVSGDVSKSSSDSMFR
jgi:hypothetical protein